MTSPGHGKHIDLDEGSAMHLENAQGTTLRVTRGLLWVTQDRDLRDIVLRPGDNWMIERGGLTIASAQADSSVAVVGPGADKLDARGHRLTWPARVAAWLERFDNARVGKRWAPYV